MGVSVQSFHNHTLGTVIPYELIDEKINQSSIKGMIIIDDLYEDYKYNLILIKVDYNENIPKIFNQFIIFFKNSNTKTPTNLYQMQWFTLQQMCNFCMHPYYDIRMDKGLKNGFLSLLKKHNLQYVL